MQLDINIDIIDLRQLLIGTGFISIEVEQMTDAEVKHIWEERIAKYLNEKLEKPVLIY